MSPYMDVYTTLTPSEAVVYLRLSLMAENGKVRARFADVARLANVSRATMKRVVHSLKARGLVEVSWQQKSPAVFTLKGGEMKDAQSRPKFYDQFSPEDRELYLFAKRSISPKEMQEIEREALEQGRDSDALIVVRVFGAERIKKYEHLLGKRSGGV
jgi:sugar-specific transcriptional regulator TrmB